MKKHGTKVGMVNSTSASETKKNKRNSNKTIRQAGNNICGMTEEERKEWFKDRVSSGTGFCS